MNIDFAYCEQLNKLVNIFDAHNEYFNQQKPRQRYDFLCSDEECRNKNETKIVGVNYDKNPEENNMYRAPHFRDPGGHIDTCEWIEIENVKDFIIDSEEDEDKQKILRNLAKRKTNLIEVFSPVIENKNNDIDINGITNILKEIKKIENKEERLKEYSKSYSKQMSKTSKLHKVVSCFLILRNIKALKEIYLDIDNHVMTYYRAFCHVKYYANGLTGRILYGGAKVKKYKTGYAFYFYDSSTSDWEHKDKKISLFINNKKLQEYRHNSYLTELLETSLEPSIKYVTWRP